MSDEVGNAGGDTEVRADSGVQPDGSWVPAFEGQRPPFAPGNQLSRGNPGPVRHGAHAPRYINPLVQELVGSVLSDAAVAHAHAPAYRHALYAWARAEAQVVLLTEYLAKAGERTEDGVGNLKAEEVRSAYLLLHRAEGRATTQRTRLGLDPLSRARLGKDVAAGQLDAARLMAELEERDRAAVGPPVEGSAEDVRPEPAETGDRGVST